MTASSVASTSSWSVGAPPQRTVARPVANLGNTCYMNAVLQALAHAPELCLALDCEPHHVNCPKRRSPSSSPDGGGGPTDVSSFHRRGTRKSRRHSPSSSGSHGGTNSKAGESNFCALCEIEEHIRRVHSPGMDKPVAPTTFVHGFIDHVAPWFKLGVQEDSHEFLRLLIDAMQKCCVKARPRNTSSSPIQEERQSTQLPSSVDSEYPFALFRGMVESCVTCGSCQVTSSTFDPIEDIGLEVSNQATTTASATTATSSTAARNSPIPPPQLTDVQAAFQRFARIEALDAGYKCDKCGKVGRATKQSRLASIPPILTLQLKRFRYGDTRSTLGGTNMSSSTTSTGNHSNQASTGTSTTGSNTAAPTTRTNRRSEVNQLSDQYWTAGKTGSAKIEGHIKFDLFFDLWPYLTEDLQKKHKNMFCRLFAVIVHAGKNSHSGHYIAYVRNLQKNEWWKMDDGRVLLVSEHEVKQAEAYMLFYRIVQHPVTIRLEELHRQQQEAVMLAAADLEDDVNNNNNENTDRHNHDIIPATNGVEKRMTRATTSRKRRALDEFVDGVEWAQMKTNLPPHLLSLIRKVQEMLADEVQLSPEFFKLLSTEADKEGVIVGKGPTSVISGMFFVFFVDSIMTINISYCISPYRFLFPLNVNL